MSKSEFADAAAPELLNRRLAGGVMQPGHFADEFWCSAMGGNGNGSEKRKTTSAAAEPVCGKLRLLFDGVASEPMPDTLASLCDKLDSAFERGELFAPKTKGRRR